MWRYIKEAFLAPVRVPLLGGVPVNALACLGLAILGFGNPGFWLLGIGAEVAYLTGLATNRRFRRWVEAKGRTVTEHNAAAQLAAVLARLGPVYQRTFGALEEKLQKVRETYRVNLIEDVIADTNLAALDRLREIYARLLLARQQLEQREAEDDPAALRREVAGLEAELADAAMPPSLRRSKTATLEILERRLRALQAREAAQEEVASDLRRIESQFDLALDNVSMVTKPPTISMDIELSSHVLDPGAYDFEATRRPIAQ
jgi:hypothetical protein